MYVSSWGEDMLALIVNINCTGYQESILSEDSKVVHFVKIL